MGPCELICAVLFGMLAYRVLCDDDADDIADAVVKKLKDKGNANG